MTRALPACLLLGLAAGCDSGEPASQVVGQLESDRIEISAEFAEPITAILVEEGEVVAAGQPLMEQDTARIRARIAETEALLGQNRARLAELTRGPRSEQIAAARASVEGATREVEFRNIEYARAQSIFERNLAARETVDQAKVSLDSAIANLEALEARLTELLEGTTIEELQQAESAADRVSAQLDALEIDLARHRPRAPVAGIVDSRLFEVGERPGAGQPMLVLLAGEQPYARVFVPEALRVRITPGTEALVYVDGISDPVDGRVRWVASEAAFTPYLALTEHDRGRLTFPAKVDLLGIERRLPDGVPVEVRFRIDGRDD
jgi:HlyD family secretion protein